MQISEKIKEIRKNTGMNRKEFCEQFGIPVRTIEEWEAGRRTPPEYVVRLLSYYIYNNLNIKKNDIRYETEANRKVNIIEDIDGNKIVVIHDIKFKGKRKINWDDVEEYLKKYIGECYIIDDTKDFVYIGKDLADEYTGSKYTEKLKGTLAKAKANASQGIPEMIEIATGKRFKENFAKKHNTNAKYGWYRYDTRFALPVYAQDQSIERYNVFYVELLLRHASDGKMYLYDLINIKKETSTPLEQ